VLNTGHGSLWLDRWPEPRAAIASSGANWALLGSPAALQPEDLQNIIVGRLAFIDAAAAFEPLLQRAFPALKVWPRVILSYAAKPASQKDQASLRQLPSYAAKATRHEHYEMLRQLRPSDAQAIAALEPDLAWIASTWGGAAGLASSGHAWGAFVDNALGAIACSFFVGERYEDIGVITRSDHRGRGLATGCARRLCADIIARGRQPTWSTSPDNAASLRVAEKLGFALHHRARLFVRVTAPEPAAAASDRG
jgi:RimJ/RimL family protein N-acetyltransferase